MIEEIFRSKEEQSAEDITRPSFGSASLPAEPELDNEENDLIFERKKIISVQRNINGTVDGDEHFTATESTTFPFIWNGSDDLVEAFDGDTVEISLEGMGSKEPTAMDKTEVSETQASKEIDRSTESMQEFQEKKIPTDFEASSQPSPTLTIPPSDANDFIFSSDGLIDVATSIGPNVLTSEKSSDSFSSGSSGGFMETTKEPDLLFTGKVAAEERTVEESIKNTISSTDNFDTDKPVTSVATSIVSSTIPEITSTGASVGQTSMEDISEVSTEATHDNTLTTPKMPTVFDITVWLPSNYNGTRNKFLLVDEVSYTEDKSKTTFIIEEEGNPASGLDEEDSDESYDELYSDQSSQSMNGTVANKELESTNSATKNIHKTQSIPEMHTSKQVNDVSDWIENAKGYHRNRPSLDKPVTSKDFELLKVGFATTTAENGKISRTGSQVNALSQTLDPVKADFTPEIPDKLFSDKLSLHLSKSNANEQGGIVPLNHISTTPISEFEEIAVRNKIYTKIVHHGMRLLRTKKFTGNDPFSPTTTTLADLLLQSQ